MLKHTDIVKGEMGMLLKALRGWQPPLVCSCSEKGIQITLLSCKRVDLWLVTCFLLF